MADRKQIDSYKNPLTGEVVEFRHGIDASPPVSWAYLGSTSPVTDAEWERARQAQLDQRIEAGLEIREALQLPPRTPAGPQLGILPEPRCSDTDRARYSARIDEAYAVGMITKDEWEARQQAITDARTFTDLAKLTTDIPEVKDTSIPGTRCTSRVTYVSKPDNPDVMSYVMRRVHFALIILSILLACFVPFNLPLSEAFPFTFAAVTLFLVNLIAFVKSSRK